MRLQMKLCCCLDECNWYALNLTLFTMVNLLPSCAQLAAVQWGKWIHAYNIRIGLLSDILVGIALKDMYAKCGKIELARQYFDEMSK